MILRLVAVVDWWVTQCIYTGICHREPQVFKGYISAHVETLLTTPST